MYGVVAFGATQRPQLIYSLYSTHKLAETKATNLEEQRPDKMESTHPNVS